MGYESKIFVVDVRRYGDWNFAERIATFDLCVLGYKDNFEGIFKNPIDYELYMEDGNTLFDKDRYGQHLHSAPISAVVEKLEEMAKNDNYRRFAPCIALLKGFDESQWHCLEVVHYGH